jgi:hypothetical protein
VLAAATAAFGALVSWYSQPYSSTGHQAPGLLENSPFANLFGLREVSRAGWIRAVPGSARLHAVDQLPAGQPFLAFQWIEGGWLLALSVLLIAATIWLVRRRAA